jgi:hypothetical protein
VGGLHIESRKILILRLKGLAFLEMTTKKTYNLSTIKTLIDLNGDSINFEATFKIVSKNKQPFYILVIDQTGLDNNPNPEYQVADKGEISGTIKQDKNVYQNFFILLKADKPCECDVLIEKRELPKNNNLALPQAVLPQAVLPPGGLPHGGQAPSQNNTTEEKSSFSLFKILFIIGAILVIAYLFYLYSKKDSKQVENTVPKNVKVYSASASEVGSPKASPAPSAEENPLLSRLKKLKI